MSARTSFVCESCGAESAKWAGRCAECGAWNSLVESPVAARAGARSARQVSGPGARQASRVVAAEEVSIGAEAHHSTGLSELDRALGGGVVNGGVVLIGGDPGIGKSTLLIQALTRLGESGFGPILYVSGEESLSQVLARAKRLALPTGSLRLLAETQTERILSHMAVERPRAVVADSIQTLYTAALQSAPGSVAQVRESAAQLVRHAKETDTVLFLVGHVTKEGALAGPRVLEHMVDTVLYFEAEEGSRFRVLRAVKNRYGAANELGLFAMTDKGLREVSNPSAMFLSRRVADVPGSVVMVTREGTRPLLVEVQSLVDDSQLGVPRRVSVGLDGQRLALLLAVMHKHSRCPLHQQDVFVNVVGGVRVTETAADLAVVMAVLSSLRGQPLPGKTVVFGEVGLGGEIRPVPNGEDRLREAAKHGFERAVLPAANNPRRGDLGLETVPVSHLHDVQDLI